MNKTTGADSIASSIAFFVSCDMNLWKLRCDLKAGRRSGLLVAKNLENIVGIGKPERSDFNCEASLLGLKKYQSNVGRSIAVQYFSISLYVG